MAAVEKKVMKAYGISKLTKMSSCLVSNTDQMEYVDTASKFQFRTVKYPYSTTKLLGHCFPRTGTKLEGPICLGDMLGNKPQYDHGELVVNFFKNNPCSGNLTSAPGPAPAPGPVPYFKIK